jgi:hypothetical protein
MLVKAFKGRYRKRGTWDSRDEFVAHVEAAWSEYNERYAHPLRWMWTNPQMRRWFAQHAP